MSRGQQLWLLGAGLVVLPTFVVGICSPPSVSGLFYLLALLCVWLGPVMVRSTHKRWQKRVLRVSGTGLFAVVFLFRMLTPQTGAFRYQQVGTPSVSRSMLARSINERDLSGSASTLLDVFSHLPEAKRLRGLFRVTYDAMELAESESGNSDESAFSPLLPTLIAGQSPESFDMLHYEVHAPRGTVVFLHGLGGNIASICWEVAQAAKSANFETRCPSIAATGNWESEEGRAIVEATLHTIEHDGPIVLIGLSRGAHGAALLAPQLRSELDGVVLISGAARAQVAQLPTLLIYGTEDPMFPEEIVQHYAEALETFSRMNPHVQVRIRRFHAGHFLVLSERTEVRAALSRFLEALD